MNTPYPLLDVAVLIVGRGEHVLLDYKDTWSAFSLPFSKLRDLPPTVSGGEGSSEAPLDAAIRAAVEVLGVPLGPTQLPTRIDADIPPFQQSGRDGCWKRYRFHVFGLSTDRDPRPLAGHTAAWLRLDDTLTHQPISPTTAHVLNSVPMPTLKALSA